MKLLPLGQPYLSLTRYFTRRRLQPAAHLPCDRWYSRHYNGFSTSHLQQADHQCTPVCYGHTCTRPSTSRSAPCRSQTNHQIVRLEKRRRVPYLYVVVSNRPWTIKSILVDTTVAIPAGGRSIPKGPNIDALQVTGEPVNTAAGRHFSGLRVVGLGQSDIWLLVTLLKTGRQCRRHDSTTPQKVPPPASALYSTASSLSRSCDTLLPTTHAYLRRRRTRNARRRVMTAADVPAAGMPRLAAHRISRMTPLLRAPAHSKVLFCERGRTMPADGVCTLPEIPAWRCVDF